MYILESSHAMLKQVEKEKITRWKKTQWVGAQGSSCINVPKFEMRLKLTEPQEVKVTSGTETRQRYSGLWMKSCRLGQESNFERADVWVRWVFPYDFVQLILIIHGFQICKFTYSLKCICNPQTDTHSAFAVIHRYPQSCEKSELPNVPFPDWAWTRLWGTFLFQLSYCKQVSFGGLFNAIFPPFFVLFWTILLFKSSLKLNTKVLSSVLSAKRQWCTWPTKCKCQISFTQAWLYVDGCEVNVSESTMCMWCF